MKATITYIFEESEKPKTKTIVIIGSDKTELRRRTNDFVHSITQMDCQGLDLTVKYKSYDVESIEETKKEFKDVTKLILLDSNKQRDREI